MEIKWLEDFVSLARTRSFSRSAELRHVTQPAFSRRIQALEAWLGSELIDRSSYPTRLTSAGEVFYEQALALLSQAQEARALLREQRSADHSVIDFAVPHTLSMTFFPRWLKTLEKRLGRLRTRLRALNVHDAAMSLTDGGCDLLMCYYHPSQPLQLDASRYEMLVLGVERFSPYSAVTASKRPRFRLPGTPDAPVPYLAYTANAYLGRMADLLVGDPGGAPYLDKVYETDMAEALKSMVLAGHGVAFLPESAVVDALARQELADLAPAAKGASPWRLDMEIRLYRDRLAYAEASHRRERAKRDALQALWEAVNDQMKAGAASTNG
ncbi:LysR family transcriptional regulator [Pandoraea terrae]|uniref:LysR family transcriptional regulator n=1 Tax=Pandoraea terrae TaxID=1537710 RepID=A0A5E4TYY1_9BURK|nr:LysR family transcriptional regulator [Pandoraea terrae]VVD93057.1 LysR family transcriptional regulator [Pandoraea terrae]